MFYIFTLTRLFWECQIRNTIKYMFYEKIMRVFSRSNKESRSYTFVCFITKRYNSVIQSSYCPKVLNMFNHYNFKHMKVSTLLSIINVIICKRKFTETPSPLFPRKRNKTKNKKSYSKTVKI